MYLKINMKQQRAENSQDSVEEWEEGNLSHSVVKLSKTTVVKAGRWQGRTRGANATGQSPEAVGHTDRNLVYDRGGNTTK